MLFVLSSSPNTSSNLWMAINAHILTVLRRREHTTYVIHTSITYKLYWLYLVFKSSVNIREVAH